MKKRDSVLLALGTIAFILVLGSGFQPAGAEQFKITKVYDGDTVRAEGQGVVIYVMLLGIDAPEIPEPGENEGQPFGEEARRFLSDMVLDKFVEVKGYGSGPSPDDKILGVIFVGDENVNLAMVKHGMAEAYKEELPKGFDPAPYIAAEKEARAGKLGIWSQGDQYISPRQWRLRKQQR